MLAAYEECEYGQPSTLALSCPTECLCMNEHRRRQLEFANKAAGTIQDGNGESKMLEVVF